MKEETTHLPLRKELFWDVDPKKINFEEHSRYIIERVLERGNDEEARWVYKRYSHSLIRETLQASRKVSPKTKGLWLSLV